MLATLLEPRFQSCKETGALPGDDRKATVSGESQRPCHCHSSPLFGSLHRLLGRAPESIYGTGEVIKVKVTASTSKKPTNATFMATKELVPSTGLLPFYGGRAVLLGHSLYDETP